MPVKRFLRRFGAAKSGLALLEFALTLPIVLPLGMYSIELSNFALTQLKLSQLALALADNASRVGVDTNVATQLLREVDVDDVMQGVRVQGGSIDLPENDAHVRIKAGSLDVPSNGRITLSSLEVNGWGGQYIHWQRCLGVKKGTGYDSSYGVTGTGSSILDLFTGMGDPGAKVTAPPNAAVMFVEINYDYTPLVTSYFLGDTHLHSVASLIVRDNRDLSQGVVASPPAISMTCDKYTT